MDRPTATVAALAPVPSPDASGVPAPAWLLDALPSGVIVIDPLGTIRHANRHVCDLLGWDRASVAGRSILDALAPDDVELAGIALAEGATYFGSVLGPMRMRFVDADGCVSFTEMWARELDDRSGYAIVVPHGSVVDVIGDAVQAIATGQPIERAVELLVGGFGMYPMTGAACVMRVTDTGVVPMTHWPFAPDIVDLPEAPWRIAARSGRGLDVNDPDELPASVRDGLGAAFAGSLWCRPVIGRRGEVSAVIVVFRPLVRPPTANQSARMAQLVNVAALAFDQLEYRHALERAAFTDPLTGAATRARLRQELDDGLVWSAVLYLDLDGFKDVNDAHGHGAGDDVLAEVGSRLHRVLRSDDLVVRIGGDEFVVVVRDATGDDAVRIANRIAAVIPEPIVVEGKTGRRSVTVGASIGVCSRGDATAFDEATRLADEALGVAKELGKGRVVVASR